MKIRAGVFFGGASVEHEVSVITAMQAIGAMDETKYQVIPVYVSKAGEFYTGDHLKQLETYRDIPTALKNAQKVVLMKQKDQTVLVLEKQKPFGSSVVATLDVALPIFHGTGGEDGTMQAHFERLELPYTGPDVCASAIGMDKWAMKAMFNIAGVPCLPGVKAGRGAYYTDPDAMMDEIERKIGYPVIVKPYNLGSSVGIGKARNRQALEEALEEAFRYAEYALCERAIEKLREINCSVLGDADETRASVCEEPLNATDFLTYADKYQSGGGSKGSKGAKSGGESAGMSSLARKVPADLDEETAAKIRQLCVDAFRAINAAGVCRVDCMMDGDSGEIFVNEINTIPGSLSFYLWEASGLSFAALMVELVRIALKRQRQRKQLQFSFDTNLLSTAQLGGAKGSKGAKR